MIQIQNDWHCLLVMLIALVNCLVLLEFTGKLGLERVPPHFRPKHARLKLSPSLSRDGPLKWMSKTAESPRELLEGQPFPPEGYCGLSQDIKIPGVGMGSRELSHAMLIHGGKVQSGTPASCLNFPSHFCWMLLSAQFDIIYLPLSM